MAYKRKTTKKSSSRTKKKPLTKREYSKLSPTAKRALKRALKRR